MKTLVAILLFVQVLQTASILNMQSNLNAARDNIRAVIQVVYNTQTAIADLALWMAEETEKEDVESPGKRF